MRRLVWALLLCPSLAAEAQGGRTPAGRPSIAAADSVLAAGDSAGAMAMYVARVHADRNDAVAWHRQGMLAWSMARENQGKGIMKAKDISLLTHADTALRLAAHIARDSAAYYTDLGRFMLASNVMTMRMAAYGTFDEALASAKRGGNPIAIADAADEVGMVLWRRYEQFANRRELRGHETPGIDPENQRPDEIRNYVENFTMKLSDFPGENDYRKAVERFEEALKVLPGHPRALRHLFMALAELGQWEELKRAARARLDSAKWDPLPWMALGLAAHRLNHEHESAVSFDSAMMFLPEEDRARYNAISRIVRPSDSASFNATDADAKDYTAEKYWVLSDPLWLTPQNEHRLEFLSRIAYAEIRWTSEDFRLKGADTDRGDIHVRYGPPDQVLGFQGMTTWIYRSGMTFVFKQPPTWGTARHENYEHVRVMAQTSPVRWDNVATDRRTDSVRVQLSRFRAGRDSSDILMVAQIPIDSIMRGMDLKSAPVDIDFQMYSDVFRRVLRDSARFIVIPGQPSGADMRAWRRRVPVGSFFYRVEAFQPGIFRGARAVGTSTIGRDTSFTVSGFGMSDIVVAERVTPREGSTGSRWSDFSIAPGIGRLRQGQSVALLWETYELGVRDNANRYKVEVSLTKVRREGAIGMAVKVIGGVAGAVGATDKGKGKVTLRYDRNVPATETAVDYLTVDLGEAPRGRYILRVEIIDAVTGRRVARERPVTIIGEE